MELDLREAAEYCIQIARYAGAYLRSSYGNVKLESKSSSAPKGADSDTFCAVTEVDRQLQRSIAKMLLTKYPTFEFFGEEDSADVFDASQDGEVLGKINSNKSAYQFVIDPLDGTYRYATMDSRHGFFLGLLRDQDLVLAVSYSPRQDILIHAIKGVGCYRNDRPFQFQSSIDDHVLINSKAAKNLDLLQTLKDSDLFVIRPKHTGSMYDMLMLEYAASMISLQTNTHDHVASLAVEEAGGCALVFDGRKLIPASGFNWRTAHRKEGNGIPAYIAANSPEQAYRLADILNDFL